MRKLLNINLEHFVTSDGLPMVKRTMYIMCPNGKIRKPVDYYDATPGVVRVTQQELDNLGVPGYQKLI